AGIKLFFKHDPDLMSEADVLVNIGNGNPYQLPSKVIEYACLGKPILHLSTGDKDCASEFLRDYEVSLTLETKGSEELPRQARRVSEFINQSAPMQGGNLSRLRSRFKPETVANQYLDCIQEARGMAQI
ncbi:MAG: glycosyltransferase, partial [Candidatus Zixiibacteriota bacterium]